MLSKVILCVVLMIVSGYGVVYSVPVGFEFLNPWPTPPETSPPTDQEYAFPGVPESLYQGLDNYPEGMISYFDFPDGLGNHTHMWFTCGGRSFYMRGPDIENLSAYPLEAGNFWSNSVLPGAGVMKSNTVAIGRFGLEGLASAVIAGTDDLVVRYRDSVGDWQSQVLETSPAPGSVASPALPASLVPRPCVSGTSGSQQEARCSPCGVA